MPPLTARNEAVGSRPGPARSGPNRSGLDEVLSSSANPCRFVSRRFRVLCKFEIESQIIMMN